MDSRARFSAAAADYDAGRPGYPEALLDRLLAAAAVPPGATVIDVGCGTGIAARQLAARGLRVIGVEPNAAMRAEAIARGGGPVYVAGEATATGLPAGQAALVYAAQAFHYFPLADTLREWRRLLAPGGACAALWYRLARSSIKEAFRAVRARHATPDAASHADRATRKADIVDALRGLPELQVEVLKAREVMRLDRAGLDRRLSSSSALAMAEGDVGEREALAGEVDALFERYREGDAVSLPLKYTAVVWRFAD